MRTYLNFIVNIDGCNAYFYAVGSQGTGLRWHWFADGTSDLIDQEAGKILTLLNHDPPIPAVQMWLSSGQYGGMTLKEFLESVE